TFAVTMLQGSEKINVIPPEASAEIDCRMLAGDDPEEIAGWVRRVVDDEHVEVAISREPKVPNLSPPDTELYKAMADTLRRRVPGAGGAAAPHGDGRLRAEDGDAAHPPDPRPLRHQVRLLHPRLDHRALPGHGPRGPETRPRDRPPRVPAREAVLPLGPRRGRSPA